MLTAALGLVPLSDVHALWSVVSILLLESVSTAFHLKTWVPITIVTLSVLHSSISRWSMFVLPVSCLLTKVFLITTLGGRWVMIRRHFKFSMPPFFYFWLSDFASSKLHPAFRTRWAEIINSYKNRHAEPMCSDRPICTQNNK